MPVCKDGEIRTVDPIAIAATVLYVSCIKNGENIKQDKFQMLQE